MRKPVFINGRFLTQPVTGVQRYAREIVSRLVLLDPGRFVVLTPKMKITDIPEILQARVVQIGCFQGHLWEQCELGPYVWWHQGILYSPTMSNPILISDQWLTVHDLFVLQHPEWVGKYFHWFYRWLLPILVRQSKGVLTVSEYSRLELLRHFRIPQEIVHVVFNGVDVRFRPVSNEDANSIRVKYALPAKFFFVLGSLEPRKNIVRLIEAWRALPSENRWPLLIAGKLGANQVFGQFDIASLIRKDDHILLLGYVPDDDLPALYSLTSVFVYVSLLEGFGLPPLEAAACGTKVLTSNNSGMSEVMQGIATLVDPYDVQSITNGLQHAMQLEFIGNEARRALQKRYDWDQSAMKLFEILRNETDLTVK
jgi:glycosyltransferase involved in cell wall biosynthesis